ncbi:type III-A CRISPR-associated RAMP protein Csm3 [Malaciobacter molluscorum]|uniref:type III-A CRISPR-associated RAMP protein Csm3 n=1 Tax=Malaciobacter molluscorum TaxID=1032072 RepID=UPI00100B7909|nr:type III-A CRISPR-associated RAMP protein Csm3 [Malaciobacter molluscorum]RXJ94648.1 type III-A CRISPR-associated RAMP protein Csm3 [Malaciobacter molluscorum]
MLEIVEVKGKIVLESGLHIGGSESNMDIGGVSGIIKHIQTDEPYIPGSSVKGKIRSLLEQKYGFNEIFNGETTSIECLDFQLNNRDKDNKKKIKDKYDVMKKKVEEENLKDKLLLICKLFGDTSKNSLRKEIGVTRSVFNDSLLNENYKELSNDSGFIELKTENNVNGVTAHATPRTKERVVEGAEFDLRIAVKIMKENEKNDLLKLLFEGLDLLEKDYLGGHGSRGSGKIRIEFDENTKKLKDTLE